jgi:hypothetical protein
MPLMYWREYRTQVHIAQAYGISESTVCHTIRKVEIPFLKSGRFRLPGKKVLQSSDTAIERPQKSNRDTTAAIRGGTLRKNK